MSKERLNLVVICLDTFRADMIGDDKKLSFVQTPNLDQFAGESVSFEQAFGEGQPTLQIRRAMFTGMRSFPWRYNFDRRGHWHHAAGWHKIPPEQETLAEILVRQGYMTALIADTYHMFKSTMNYTRGFVNYEFVRGQESDNWRGGSLRHIEDQLKQHVRDVSHASPTLIQYLLNMRGRLSEEDYLCARVFQNAAQWLEDSTENQPFCLWVDSFDPHEPWDPPKSYTDRYAPGYDGLDFIMPGDAYRGKKPSEEELERVKALYFGEATFVDRWVGLLLEKLDALNLRDNTIVMVTCDHGTQILDHGHFGKGPNKLHPFNTQILWHVRHPDGPSGRKIQPFVQSHDLMPTALNLLGYPASFCDGEDVWPLVTGGKASIRDHVITGWAGWNDGPAKGRASVRDHSWNYTVAVGYSDDGSELFHLPDDPAETNNVIAEHPEIERKQKARLEALLGQPAEMPMNEITDSNAPAPMVSYLAAKRRQGDRQ